MTKKGCLAQKIGLSMVLGGAISNLYDRLVKGYVVDYFSIEFKRLKKVIFNLGDILYFRQPGISDRGTVGGYRP